MRKLQIIGIVAIFFSIACFGQKPKQPSIESKIVSTTDSVNASNGKIVINTKLLESYLKFVNSKDSIITWIDLLKGWDSETLHEFYASYINFDAKKTSLKEVNDYLARKYKERQDSISLKATDQNYITNVEFEEP